MTDTDSKTLVKLSHGEQERLMQAIRSGASRRELLGLMAGLGLGAALGGSVIGAATTAHAQAAKKGGKIRVAGFGSSTADTLDPAKQSYSTDYCRCTMFYNGLTELDEMMAPQLALAESIDNEKATVWTIKLRRGVQFHDGKELTSEDVVFSLKRHHDPAVGTKAKALADQMKEIVATGKHEVKITLAARTPTCRSYSAPITFSSHRPGRPTSPRASGPGRSSARNSRRASVPSRCATRITGSRAAGLTSTRSSSSGIPDVGARVNALMAGDVHMIGNVNPASARLILGAKGLKIMETKSGNYSNLIMKLDQAPGITRTS